MSGFAVVMACDAGYLPFALTLAATVAERHPRRGFDMLLAAAEPLAVPPAFDALGLRLVMLDNPFRAAPADRHGQAAYLRLALPGRLTEEYRRLLYLDSDILCLGGGLDRLLGADLGGAWLGAVRDNLQWRTPGRRLPEFRAAGRPARPYLNSGVLLIDTALWRAERLGERALALAAERRDLLGRHDQSLLNLLADGGWAEMSPVWNWQYGWSSRLFAEIAEPRLMHFIGPNKPWADAEARLPARFRAPYAETLRHFPERPLPAAAERMGWPADLRRSLVKHWLAEPAMRRYLARFPDPFRLMPAA